MRVFSILISWLGRGLGIVALALAPPARGQEAKPPAPKEMKNPVAHTRASVARGKSIYLRHCRACHDFDGKGLIGVDFVQTPLPDLTNPTTFKHGDSDGEMFVIIRDGTKTDMESFKAKLSEEEMWHLVNFIHSLRPKARPFVEPPAEGEKKKDEATKEAVDPKTLKNPVEYTRASIGLGKQVYLRNCRACHDFDGTGKAGVDFVTTPLPDLTDPKTWKHGQTDGEIFTIIRNGTKTDMEAFKDKLKVEDTWRLVNYIRSIGPKNLMPPIKEEGPK